MIAELFLSYQKRALDLRLKQDPIRHGIRAHNKAMKESVERIKGAAESQLQELDRELPQRAQQFDNCSNSLRAVETQLFGSDAAARARDVDFLSEEESKAEVKKDKEEKDPNLVRAEKARELLDEMEGHTSSLKRDVEVVKKSLGLLESKLRRSATVAETQK